MSEVHTYTIYHALEIKASCEKIFETISNPTELNNWSAIKCSDIAAQEGSL